MSRERREQPPSSTQTLDAILSKLGPPILKLEVSITKSTKKFKGAYERLSKKAEQDTLTQMDIERELNSMPDMGGVEEIRRQLVDAIRIRIPGLDIKKLPVDVSIQEK